MMAGTRGLKTGDLVRLPVPGGKPRTAVVESVSLDGLRFADTHGAAHLTAATELVPLADAAFTARGCCVYRSRMLRLPRSPPPVSCSGAVTAEARQPAGMRVPGLC